MNMLRAKKQTYTLSSGFTLVELVTVIVILGVLSVGVTGFLKFGTQIYTEANDRDHLISSGRFAVERLNREIRTALSNSIRIVDGSGGDYDAAQDTSQCLEYTPVVASSIYTDIPVSPEAASNTVTVFPFDDSDFTEGLRVAVYTLTSDNVYVDNDRIFAIDSDVGSYGITKSDSNEWIITLDSAIQFPYDSPTERMFFIDDSVTFCLDYSAEQLLRDDVLMAEQINGDSSFEIAAATQYRNAMVQVRLEFEQNEEVAVFNNEVQVPNVP